MATAALPPARSGAAPTGSSNGSQAGQVAALAESGKMVARGFAYRTKELLLASMILVAGLLWKDAIQDSIKGSEFLHKYGGLWILAIVVTLAITAAIFVLEVVLPSSENVTEEAVISHLKNTNK